MSAINGDKSRFNRERKQKIARRKRKNQLLHIAPSAAANAGKSAPRKDSVSS